MRGILSLGEVKGTTVFLVDASTIGNRKFINRKFIDTRIKT